MTGRPISPSAGNTLATAARRAGFEGPVIGPDDAGYDTARAVFYGHIDRRPAAVMRPAHAADVRRAIGLARQTGLVLAIRGGGHSLAGHSAVEGGIVLDLSGLKGLEIDVAEASAWAGAGLTAGEYSRAAGQYGLATGFGDTGAVGIGGLTVGGGIGYLVRKHGLTIDNLLAAEICTADGRLLLANADSHPDLFWAIRGGGGNFGVVTRFQYRLHPLPSIVGGMLILPATVDTLTALIAAAEAAPDELSLIANVMIAPPVPFLPSEAYGRPIVMVLLAYAGETAAGELAIAPLRAIAPPLADALRPMPYPELFDVMGEDGPGPAQDVTRSLFFDTFDRALAERVLERLRSSTALMSVAQLRVLGGAMARVPVEATAFAHRQRRLMAAIGAIYEDPAETPAHTAWAEALAADLRQGEPGVYVNFLADEDPARRREAYPGPTWERLAAVKARYDPTNLFRHNHNIPPEQMN